MRFLAIDSLFAMKTNLSFMLHLLTAVGFMKCSYCCKRLHGNYYLCLFWGFFFSVFLLVVCHQSYTARNQDPAAFCLALWQIWTQQLSWRSGNSIRFLELWKSGRWVVCAPAQGKDFQGPMKLLRSKFSKA